MEDQKRVAKWSRCTSPSSHTVTLRAGRMPRQQGRTRRPRLGDAPDGAQREGRDDGEVRARLREGDACARPRGRVVGVSLGRLGRGGRALAGLAVSRLSSLPALALGDARRLQVLGSLIAESGAASAFSPPGAAAARRWPQHARRALATHHGRRSAVAARRPRRHLVALGRDPAWAGSAAQRSALHALHARARQPSRATRRGGTPGASGARRARERARVRRPGGRTSHRANSRRAELRRRVRQAQRSQLLLVVCYAPQPSRLILVHCRRRWLHAGGAPCFAAAW